MCEREKGEVIVGDLGGEWPPSFSSGRLSDG